uniref:NADH dehydrogenase [ubiquinone] 1 alpha subcomplex subunit 10, mitochondrial-like isoform X1 n=1 Tax=Myxine glutinosa TaxID=7769 RepID=UPI00358ED8D2
MLGRSLHQGVTALAVNLLYGRSREWIRSISSSMWNYRGLRTSKCTRKVVVLDGNLAAGKTTLGQLVAEKIGFLYTNEAIMSSLEDQQQEKVLHLPYLNGELGSLERFYDDPESSDDNAFRLQLCMFYTRLLQYADALKHLFKTGQGVVLDRSIYSDFVFLETMHRQGFIPKHYVQMYNEMKQNVFVKLPAPHVVIYLDVSIHEIQRRLVVRGRPFEQNISDCYLKEIEDVYKERFLPQMHQTSAVLHYDWSNFGDVDKVVADIEATGAASRPFIDNMKDDDIQQLLLLIQDKQRVIELATTSRCDTHVSAASLAPKHD